jgi:hypothetical protein
MVSPFVGRLSASVSLRPDRREVQRVFNAPLRMFAESERRDRFVWTREEQSYEVAFVAVGDSRVWGVTLEIIDDLLIQLEGMLAP